MMKKKLLLLTTGGTIACTANSEGYSPTMDGETLLSFVPQIRENVQIDVLGIFNMDSSNMQPDDWVLIAQTIYQNVEEYDGFVILHGTDTMAYTSSALSFMTLGANKPIILTGSQIPINEPESDGPKNLYDAIGVASNSGLMGVFVVFHGRIMSGCCVSKCDSTNPDAFNSINCIDVGTVNQGKIVIHRLPPPARETVLRWHTKIDDRVLLWKLTPGVCPEILSDNVRKNYKAVILEAFGVGGLPMLKNSFLPQIMKWREEKIITIVTTQCYHGKCDMSIYETGRLALNKGAVCAGNMTREALLAKVMWLLSITDDSDTLIEMLKIDFCGEFGY